MTDPFLRPARVLRDRAQGRRNRRTRTALLRPTDPAPTSGGAARSFADHRGPLQCPRARTRTPRRALGPRKAGSGSGRASREANLLSSSPLTVRRRRHSRTQEARRHLGRGGLRAQRSPEARPSGRRVLAPAATGRGPPHRCSHRWISRRQVLTPRRESCCRRRSSSEPRQGAPVPVCRECRFDDARASTGQPLRRIGRLVVTAVTRLGAPLRSKPYTPCRW